MIQRRGDRRLVTHGPFLNLQRAANMTAKQTVYCLKQIGFEKVFERPIIDYPVFSVASELLRRINDTHDPKNAYVPGETLPMIVLNGDDLACEMIERDFPEMVGHVHRPVAPANDILMRIVLKAYFQKTQCSNVLCCGIDADLCDDLVISTGDVCELIDERFKGKAKSDGIFDDVECDPICLVYSIITRGKHLQPAMKLQNLDGAHTYTVIIHKPKWFARNPDLLSLRVGEVFDVEGLCKLLLNGRHYDVILLKN
jgi:hypothetical protein